MNWIVKYSPRAEKDINQAVAWYKTQRKGLDAEFLNCVEETVSKIKQHPKLYPKYHKNLQRAL